MIQVRDLVEHLSTYPPETRLRLVVVCLDGTLAHAEDYAMRRAEDGAHELRISGALVWQIVQDDETVANQIKDGRQ